jgi:hypothetical protein
VQRLSLAGSPERGHQVYRALILAERARLVARLKELGAAAARRARSISPCVRRFTST